MTLHCILGSYRLPLGFLMETIGSPHGWSGHPMKTPTVSSSLTPNLSLFCSVLFCSVLSAHGCRICGVAHRCSENRSREGRKPASCKRLFFYASKHIPHKVPETFNFCLELCHQFFNWFFLSAGTTTLFFGTLFVRVGRNSFFPFWQINPRCFESQWRFKAHR